MRRSLSLVFFLMIMAGCNKSTRSPIIGQWELSAVNGTIGGDTNYPPGNGNMLQFDDGGGYTAYHPGNPTQMGTYRLNPVFPFTGNYILNVDFGSIYSFRLRDSLRITHTQLIVIPNPMRADIPTMIYTRKY